MYALTQTSLGSVISKVTSIFKDYSEITGWNCDLDHEDHQQVSATQKYVGAAVAVALARYAYLKMKRWYYQLPPGPDSLIPVIGDQLRSLLTITHCYQSLPKAYGDVVYFVNELGKPAVIVTESSVARKLLSNKNALDRNFHPAFYKDHGFLIDGRNLVYQDGAEWKKNRKLHHLGLAMMDTKFVNEVVHDIIDADLQPQLEQCASSKTPWISRDVLTQLTFNVIFRANFGRNVSLEDSKLCKILSKDLADRVGFEYSSRDMVANVCPASLVPKSYLKPMWEIKTRVGDNIKRLIHQHKKEQHERMKNVENMAFMDHFDALVKEDGANYSDRQRLVDVVMLFTAGTDTTAGTLEWGMVLLAKQQDVQQKIRNELVSALKKNGIDYIKNPRQVVFDINFLLQLPLFRACLHEILRISVVARVGFAHSIHSKEDMWVTTKSGKRYRLPTGSALHYNAEGIHYDIFGQEDYKNREHGLNMQQICLENWLIEKDGKTCFNMHPALFTFGHGRRDCVGKALAMREMYVVIGFVLLNYRLDLEDKFKKADYIPVNGFTTVSAAKPEPQIPVIVERLR